MSWLAAAARGVCITPGARLARRIRREWNLHQRQRGFVAWRSPDVLPWDAWLRREWRALLYSGAPVPAPLGHWQQRLLWEGIIERSPAGGDLLRVDAAAELAAEAWALTRDWRLPLDRFDATEDSAAFRDWAREFRLVCPEPPALPGRPGDFSLLGFDRLDPSQQDIATRYGMRGVPFDPRPEGRAALAALPDPETEIDAAAEWARRILESNPAARIGIAAPRLESHRRALERALLSALHPGGSPSPAFHISLGPPLSERPAVHAALLLLGAAGEARIPLTDAGRILLSPWISGAAAERSDRARFDAWLRKDHREISLAAAAALPKCPPLLAALLSALPPSNGRRMPGEWSRDFSTLLRAWGWPGERPLSSVEFQAVEAFRSVLSELASLDAVSPALTCSGAAALVRRIAAATAFQQEDLDQPVQVLGLIEASLESFDHLWVLGLDEDAWPRAASPNPFLPLDLQWQRDMPHSTARWELESARTVTARLLCAAPEIVFSYARLAAERETSPSPLIAAFPPLDWTSRTSPPPSAPMETLSDTLAPPLDLDAAHKGGTRALQAQAACPFRAFAEFRLGAQPLESPPLGLDARTRGALLHTALKLVWSELRSQDRLLRTPPDALAELIGASVQRALLEEEGRPASVFDQRLHAVELRRLTTLIERWLAIDASRTAPFEVLPPEEPVALRLAGLNLRARIDRKDKLSDGRLVILDYKSTAPSLAAWDGDRPDQPQLPLYAVFSEGDLAAVAFAQVQSGALFFRGLGPEPFVLPGLKPAPLDERVAQWRDVLTALAAAFRDGHAAVDPKERSSCDFCPQHAFCRIDESRGAAER